MAAASSGISAPPQASSHTSPEGAASQFLERLKAPGHILVAYSGGSDSTGMLVALAAQAGARSDLKITLSAATVDHGLRPGSAREALEAGMLCERLGIPHAVLQWEGEKPATGVQAAAREARYRLLADHAETIGADVFVTAHTLDDQQETFAMRHARNPEVSGAISEAVLYDRRVWVFRPFLEVRREEIRNFLSKRGVGWVDDPSNENSAFERVRIRKGGTGGMRAAEFRMLAAARQRLAGHISEWIAGHTLMRSPLVAEVGLSGFSAAEPAHLKGLLYLVAFIGGRTHISGQVTSARISAFLAGGDARLAAERVVLDRRKDRLYLARERRLIPELVVQPGRTAVWDGRFRVQNKGDKPVGIFVRGAGSPCEPILRGDLDHLPGAVRRLVEATEPVTEPGNASRVAAEPVIAPFDRFLPYDLFDIANVLANLGGLAHFLETPVR